VPIEAGVCPAPPASALGMPPGTMPETEDNMPDDIMPDIIDCIDAPPRWLRWAEAACAVVARFAPASRQTVTAIKSFFIVISREAGGNDRRSP